MNWWQKPHIFKGIPVSLPPVPYFVPFLPPTYSILSPDYVFQVLDPQQSPTALHSHQHRTDSSLWTFPLSSVVETILQCMNTSFIKDGFFRATKIIHFLPFFSRSQLQHIHLLLRKQKENRPMIQLVDTHTKIGFSTIRIESLTLKETRLLVILANLTVHSKARERQASPLLLPWHSTPCSPARLASFPLPTGCLSPHHPPLICLTHINLSGIIYSPNPSSLLLAKVSS